MNYREQIEAYRPEGGEETQDKRVALQYLAAFDNLLTRENEFAHLTASGWVVNRSFDKILMVYHNIYDSWSFVGGHADKEPDLLKTALREAAEETGVTRLWPLKEGLFSLELIGVNGHWKRGAYVSPHIHINGTFLLQAEETDPLLEKPDENSGVSWIKMREAVQVCTEPDMKKIYEKLVERTEQFQREPGRYTAHKK